MSKDDSNEKSNEAMRLFLLRKQTGTQNMKIDPVFIAPIAGFSSALIEITAIWPAEWCKTQQQLNRLNPNFNALKYMYEQGFFGVYRSLTPMLIGAPFQGLIRFTSLDYFTELFKDENGRTSKFSGLFAGITAGLLESVCVVTPMETVKTVLVDSKQGIIRGVSMVIKKDGISGLYKGLLPTAAKSASNQALRFVIYNEWKNIITMDRKVKDLSPHESLAGGMVAGLLGALGNTPFDTVKSRMQGLESKRYKGMFDCAKKMVMEEGPSSLYKGLVYRWARVVPGQGLLFLSYDFISQQLRKLSIPGPGAQKKPKLNRMGSIGSD